MSVTSWGVISTYFAFLDRGNIWLRTTLLWGPFMFNLDSVPPYFFPKVIRSSTKQMLFLFHQTYADETHVDLKEVHKNLE